MHAREIRTDLEAGDQCACVLRVRAKQGIAAGLPSRIAHRRIEHGAHFRIAGVTTARQDDGLARADANDLAPFVDIAVAPQALEPLPALRANARSVVGTDADDPSGAVLDQFVEVPVEYELDALLARGKLQRTGE